MGAHVGANADQKTSLLVSPDGKVLVLRSVIQRGARNCGRAVAPFFGWRCARRVQTIFCRLFALAQLDALKAGDLKGVRGVYVDARFVASRSEAVGAGQLLAGRFLLGSGLGASSSGGGQWQRSMVGCIANASVCMPTSPR